LISDPNLIVGMEHAEDAGVYKLRDDLAIVQTVDFFTPIVDDPYTFGQIAVTNALSDVYAMGGKPLTAMNIVCFPIRKMPVSILRDILRGGLDKMREAGVLLVGGHSIEDDEIKYGLSVTGTIHPGRVLLNRGARTGDALVLTKPLGTGIASTAVKGGVAPEPLVAAATASMTTLNKGAAEIMAEFPDVHACTDITGFGLVGHAAEMIESSEAGIVLQASRVPLFPGIRPLVEEGVVPGGLHRNRDFRLPIVSKGPDCPDWLFDVLFDPQTAGGLFIALPEPSARRLVAKLRAAGLPEAAVVGEVVGSPAGKILIA